MKYVKKSILSDESYSTELPIVLKIFYKMAVPRGVKKKESKEDILEKLKSNGEFLQNSTSTLLLEMEILNKLIYKSKNTHSKEKFFKFLERIKKCLNKWKFLSLNKKLVEMCESIGVVENLYEILKQIMLGGQLAIRVIILCQEAVQYSLAYLSRGFFVTLHVTLFSLVSRIWVLQRDCWTDLVEIYQLVLSLVQMTENHTDMNQFPECLTVWLSEDVKRIFDGRDAAISAVKSSNPILQQLFKEKEDNMNDSYTARSSEDDLNENEVDLGEPVETMGKLHFQDHSYSTPKLTKAASEPKTNLKLKFDLEHSRRESFCKNERSDEHEQLLKNTLLKNSLKVKTRYKLCSFGKRKYPMLDELQKSDSKLVPIKRIRSLHRKNNKIFIKKTPCRFTLRDLLALEDFSDCSRRHLHVVLKILRFALHSENVFPAERKILLRIQCSLGEELKKRRLRVTNKEDEALFPRKTDVNKEHEGPETFRETCTDHVDFESLNINGETIVDRKKQGKILRSPMFEERSCPEPNKRRSSSVYSRHERRARPRMSPINLKSSSFVEKDPTNRLGQNKENDRDEIDAIFSSLGV